MINANLIMGNAAESGSGGGIALPERQRLGRGRLPDQADQLVLRRSVTNNIIVDNVAGWDGAGVSLLDALNVNIINNTIVSNVTTASAGTLFEHPRCAAGEHAELPGSHLQQCVCTCSTSSMPASRQAW